MSKALMLAVWDRDLPHAEKCVLVAMAYNGDDEGNNIWPSIATIAKRAGYKPRQVHNIIARLKKKGVLCVQGRMGRMRGFVTVYSIDLSGVPLLPNPESLQSLHTTHGQHDAASRLAGASASENVQSAATSLQNSPDSMQSTTGKSATASAEEQYLIRKEQERKVASQCSISDSPDQPQKQPQPQNLPDRRKSKAEDFISTGELLRELKHVVRGRLRKSPLVDDDAYNERIAELKAQEERARQIAGERQPSISGDPAGNGYAVSKNAAAGDKMPC